MKKLVVIFVISLMSLGHLMAQKYTTIEAKSYDISDNLDLDAVASVFGESRNLQDFENKLNDPRMRLSNLDLNQDGFVDYLRVLETSEYGVQLISIQALIARDLYQDVAVISVEYDRRGRAVVQVVGDVYMYGPNYIIQPVYVHTPYIWVSFNRPYYQVWRSPYYWGYYPTYYRHRAPCHPYVYHNNVYVHVNINNHYHRVNHRYSSTSVHIQKRHRSNDYGRSNPNRSFAQRNRGVKNRAELTRKRDVAYASSTTRENRNNTYSQRNRSNVSSGREVRNNSRTSSVSVRRDANVRNSNSAVTADRSTRTSRSQYTQVSRQPERDRTSRAVRSTQSTQRQNAQLARSQNSNRQKTQSTRVQSSRTSSTTANSSRSRTIKTQSTQRQTTQKQMAKSSNRSATSGRSARSGIDSRS